MLDINNTKAGDRIKYVRNTNRVSEIKDALRKMKLGKDVGPDVILIEL